MSTAGVMLPTRVNTNETNVYDHSINLVDSTKPPPDQSPSQSNPTTETDSVSLSKTRSEAASAKKWTTGGLKEELARRKYAKWQEGATTDEEAVIESDENPIDQPETSSTGQSISKHTSIRKGRLRDKTPFRSVKKVQTSHKQQNYEVDILYENQRGFFFCGIPLYSSKSLLNFDPSPWQTAAFKDSPVNITNAQVPDPSWTWAWKSWYVDMSHDCDEEGWEYSFSFRQGFAWHGNHPWFHSYVRRRRWLRKRVKTHSTARKWDGMGESQTLHPEYFTIHPKRNRSRGSSAGASTVNRSSYISGQFGAESDQDDDEISNILVLMKALKKTAVDRKKIEAVMNFLEHGNDDICYLSEYMEEIMGMFIYQTSRRQLLAHLQTVLESTRKHREEDVEQGKPEDNAEKRRTDTLLSAIQAAANHVKDLEYWSDVKTVTQRGHDEDTDEYQNPSGRCLTVNDNEPDRNFTGKPEISLDDGHSSNDETEIKGIPEEAGIGEKPGIKWDVQEDHVHHDEMDFSKSKGKEKA